MRQRCSIEYVLHTSCSASRIRLWVDVGTGFEISTMKKLLEVSMIINLTQHQPTPAQVAEGVAPASPEVQDLLTIPVPYAGPVLQERTDALVRWALAEAGKTPAGAARDRASKAWEALNANSQAVAALRAALGYLPPGRDGDAYQTLAELLGNLPVLLKEHEESSVAVGRFSTEPYPRVMIGGLPALMPLLERALQMSGMVPVYAMSERRSTDLPQPDGSVKKVSEFAHCGFYEALLIG